MNIPTLIHSRSRIGIHPEVFEGLMRNLKLLDLHLWVWRDCYHLHSKCFTSSYQFGTDLSIGYGRISFIWRKHNVLCCCSAKWLNTAGCLHNFEQCER
jgi:hypothetical protein